MFMFPGVEDVSGVPVIVEIGVCSVVSLGVPDLFSLLIPAHGIPDAVSYVLYGLVSLGSAIYVPK